MRSSGGDSSAYVLFARGLSRFRSFIGAITVRVIIFVAAAAQMKVTIKMSGMSGEPAGWG